MANSRSSGVGYISIPFSCDLRPRRRSEDSQAGGEVVNGY